MSFSTKLIATVAALGLATSVFAADEVTTTTTQNPADTTATTAATTTTTTTTTTDAKATAQVNLNTASAEELAKVKGLTLKKSELIVKYRNDNGNFTSVEDIKKVKGLRLNAKQLKKVKSQLMVG